LSRLDRGIQSVTEMLPLKKGGGVAHSFKLHPRICRYVSCWCTCYGNGFFFSLLFLNFCLASCSL